VVSTAADLARFDAALTRGELLSAESVRRMWTPGRAADGTPLAYGLGWFVQEHAGRRLVWHAGWWPQAYSALYLKLPDERLTMIVLANSEGMWWGNPLDAATVERSVFARALLEAFPSAGATSSVQTTVTTAIPTADRR
jgi:CubicO group peptidase (beta-lactamase class C family)